MNLKLINKDVESPIGHKLSHSEFRCKCDNPDCTYTLVSPKLLELYSIIRKRWDSAIAITSGYRCQRHNRFVGGRDNSYHKKGSAIDIFPHNGDILALKELAEIFFDVVIHYEDEGFLHCHIIGDLQ